MRLVFCSASLAILILSCSFPEPGLEPDAMCDPQSCDDGNRCTDDICSASGCEHVPNTEPCNDGVFCNGDDSCADGTCSVHSGDPCYPATLCDGEQCVNCLADEECPDPSGPSWDDIDCEADDECARTGKKVRTMTVYSCVDWKCVPEKVREERECTRETDGDECPPGVIVGEWEKCEFDPENPCTEVGVQRRTVKTYTCGEEQCTPTETEETRECTRDTDGDNCKPPEYGPWSTCQFDNKCDQVGTRSRTVTIYSCSGAACSSTTTTEIGICSRNTDGDVCAAKQYGPWGTCSFEGGVCDESGTRSRSVTDFLCRAGTCTSTTGTQIGPCSQDTDGDSCGSDTCSRSWSDCSGFSNTCDETGSQSRSCTSPTCSSGSCIDVPYTQTQSCLRDTDGDTCGPKSCERWGICSGFSSTCDETGTQSRSCTTPLCSTGSCKGSWSSTETRPCTRDTDGIRCYGDNLIGWCRNGNCYSQCFDTENCPTP